MSGPADDSSYNPSLGWLARGLAILGVSGGGGGGSAYPKLIARTFSTTNLTVVGTKVLLMNPTIPAHTLNQGDAIDFSWVGVDGGDTLPSTWDIDVSIQQPVTGTRALSVWTGLNANMVYGSNRIRMWFSGTSIYSLQPLSQSFSLDPTQDATVIISGTYRGGGDAGGIFLQTKSLVLNQI